MFKRFIGIFLIGLVIKLMDDFLDKDIDKLADQWNLAIILERALLPYSLVLLIISLYLNYNESVSIFAVSYFIGMAGDYKEKLPTKLYGWQEGILVLIISIYITNLYDILSGLILVSLIQIIDDFIDFKKDFNYKAKNIIIKYGRVNAFLLAGILILLSICFFQVKTIYYFSALLLLYLLLYILSKYYRDGDVKDDF